MGVTVRLEELTTVGVCVVAGDGVDGPVVPKDCVLIGVAATGGMDMAEPEPGARVE